MLSRTNSSDISIKKILFICTGNYYRSRFAEIYFNFKSVSINSDWRAFSRGFDISNPNNIDFISSYAKEKLVELQIPLPIILELPRFLTEADFNDAQKIIALNDAEHRTLIKRDYPSWEHKTIFWKIKDIHDENAESSLKKLIKNIDEFSSFLFYSEE